MKTSNMILSLLAVTGLLLSAFPAIAQKNARKQTLPSKVSPALRTEIDKLNSKELSQQIEGAYNLGNMGARAASAVSSLVKVIQGNEGLLEVKPEWLKYFEKDTPVLSSGSKAYMINPAQIVASTALVKIGKPAIEPLRAALLKGDPEKIYFVALSLARMQEPAATKILLDLLNKPEAPQPRWEIAEVLGHNKDPMSVEPFGVGCFCYRATGRIVGRIDMGLSVMVRVLGHTRRLDMVAQGH